MAAEFTDTTRAPVDAGPVPPAPRGRAGRWLARRVPAGSRVRLNQRNIFIFPPRTGFAFFALLAVLVVAAINYQNALVFALAFLLGSLFAVAIGHTYRNLAGIEIAAQGAEPVFAGERARMVLHLRSVSGRGHRALRIGWPGEVPAELDLAPGEERTLRVPFATRQRGWHRPGRLRLETRWPVGILRAWCWLDLDQPVLVYPHPLPGPVQGLAASATEGDGEQIRGAADDFLGLREFRDGDSLKHVAWKAFARGGELRLKEFGGRADRRHWLDFDALPGLDTETRLGRLCARALELEGAGESYGLRLPDRRLDPAQGAGHLDAVLEALALYGREPVA
ncbi:MAG: DUF58 domain-containing protein [Pseudomonadales bacterium]|jgi:uncharacterized protein (DUF58 family)|nr:DUF58 domain-containing protein [Pseudomonadales bacterium]